MGPILSKQEKAVLALETMSDWRCEKARSQERRSACGCLLTVSGDSLLCQEFWRGSGKEAEAGSPDSVSFLV